MSRVRPYLRAARGLTLIELMVVVAIIAIIATVAYPVYTNQVLKTRRADAKAALENIALAQERFYTLNGQYTDDLGLLQVPDAIQAGASEQGHYAIVVAHPAGNVQQFVATATPAAGGVQAADAKCTQFTLNHLGAREATGTTPDQCW